MLKRLKDLFGSMDNSDEPMSLDSQRLAITVLLLEVAQSDDKLLDVELGRLLQILQQQWSLSGAESTALLQEATEQTNAHVSLREHLKAINSFLEPSQKATLLENLWYIASVDGEIHFREECLIRRLSVLMGVPQEKFIKGKNQALDTATYVEKPE